MQCRLLPDVVAKVFLGCQNFSGPLMHFVRDDIKTTSLRTKRSRSFVLALRNTAVAELVKNQHLRDSRRRLIFD